MPPLTFLTKVRRVIGVPPVSRDGLDQRARIGPGARSDSRNRENVLSRRESASRLEPREGGSSGAVRRSCPRAAQRHVAQKVRDHSLGQRSTTTFFCVKNSTASSPCPCRSPKKLSFQPLNGKKAIGAAIPTSMPTLQSS